MLNMIKVVFKRVLQNDVDKFDSLIKEVVRVAKAYRENSNSLTEQSKTIKNHFFKEAIELMAAGGLDGKDLDVILANVRPLTFIAMNKRPRCLKLWPNFRRRLDYSERLWESWR